jgi:hypothetical protein
VHSRGHECVELNDTPALSRCLLRKAEVLGTLDAARAAAGLGLQRRGRLPTQPLQFVTELHKLGAAPQQLPHAAFSLLAGRARLLDAVQVLRAPAPLTPTPSPPPPS